MVWRWVWCFLLFAILFASWLGVLWIGCLAVVVCWRICLFVIVAFCCVGGLLGSALVGFMFGFGCWCFGFAF